jgi:5-carboxymethyl-2-hydroxymuconic-semialdehyde dehydrogenase
MRIQHLIDGRTVEGRDYFETVNPATQEVLAEVARGGAVEVQAAVAAAKAGVSEVGRPRAGRARQADAKLGDLITRDVPALSETETATPAR